MADRYSWIVFHYKSISEEQMEHCHSFMQFKSKILSNQKSDQYFYETMMIFAAKVHSAFDKGDVPKLEEEINRLFRSNAFNISQRIQYEESRKKKYPQLKDAPPKESSTDMIKRLEMRFKIPK